MRVRPGLLLAQAGLTVLVGVFPVAASWLTKLLFDELAGPSRDAVRAGTLAAGAAALAVATLVAMHVGSYLAAAHQRAVGLAVEERLYDKVNGFVGLRRFEDPALLGRLRLAEEASGGAPQAIIGFVLEVGQTTVAVVGYLAVLLAVWPPMSLLILGAAVPVVLVQLRMARHRVVAAESTNEMVRRRFFYRSLLTDVRAVKEVRLYGLAELFGARMRRSSRVASGRELAVERRAATWNSAWSVAAAAVTGAGTVIVVAGAAAGRVTVGDIALFVAAVAGVQGGLASVAGNLGEAAAAVRLLGHYLAVLDLPPDQPAAGRPVPPLRRGIELRDVWFRYDPDGPWALRGVDLFIPAGAAVGLVGVNGAGKSTVVKLLCRFYEPERGTITWDGVDLAELDVRQLRRRVGVTFQDFMTYDLTARENVGVGDPSRLDDLDAVRRAAALADVDGVLTALPRGYATTLSRVFFDEDDDALAGATLSGGQWQRVAIARALMRDDADLLVLDEPGSGLDAEAEYAIHRALRAHRAGRTSVLVSHRLSAMRAADVIAVLEDGRVIERGDHDRLMATGGRYARLFSLQARDYQDSRV